MGIASIVGKGQQAVAVFLFIRRILADDSLRQALGVVVEALEDIAEEIPGDFPDRQLHSFQELLGLEDDDEDEDEEEEDV